MAETVAKREHRRPQRAKFCFVRVRNRGREREKAECVCAARRAHSLTHSQHTKVGEVNFEPFYCVGLGVGLKTKRLTGKCYSGRWIASKSTSTLHVQLYLIWHYTRLSLSNVIIKLVAKRERERKKTRRGRPKNKHARAEHIDWRIYCQERSISARVGANTMPVRRETPMIKSHAGDKSEIKMSAAIKFAGRHCTSWSVGGIDCFYSRLEE